MPRYSDERRQAVVAKLLPPYNQSVEDVAREEGISSATVYKWRKEARAEGRCLPDAELPVHDPVPVSHASGPAEYQEAIDAEIKRQWREWHQRHPDSDDT